MTLPVFETLRLTLRSITEHDAEGLHEAYADAEAMRIPKALVDPARFAVA